MHLVDRMRHDLEFDRGCDEKYDWQDMTLDEAQ